MEVQPLQTAAEDRQISMWKERLKENPARYLTKKIAEELPTGNLENRRSWQCLNRVRVGVCRTKVEQKRWGYIGADSDTLCACGEGEESALHLLQCRLSGGTVTKEDLAEYNEKAHVCVRRWRDLV